jgi:hypothetical protein
MLHPAIVPVLAVVSIHCIFRLYQYALERRRRQLRERVTYMLWMAAQHCKA